MIHHDVQLLGYEGNLRACCDTIDASWPQDTQRARVAAALCSAKAATVRIDTAENATKELQLLLGELVSAAIALATPEALSVVGATLAAIAAGKESQATVATLASLPAAAAAAQVTSSESESESESEVRLETACQSESRGSSGCQCQHQYGVDADLEYFIVYTVTLQVLCRSCPFLFADSCSRGSAAS
jgi:hypothetical protein